MEFVYGNKFTQLADFYWDYHIKGGGLVPEMLSKNAIIFCKTDWLPQLFNYLKFSKRKYVLVSCQSDYPINEQRYALKPSCIKKWFAQNTEVHYDDIINIPIGLENFIRSDGGRVLELEFLKNNWERLRDKRKNEDTVYCNWNDNTNPSRRKIIEVLKENGIKVEMEEKRLSMTDYWEKLSDFKYIIAPPGNGHSTIRFWESLYLGSVPIVINHRIYRDYTLPFIKLNSWKDLSNRALKEFNYTSFSLEMLDMNYWESLIRKEFKNIDL